MKAAVISLGSKSSLMIIKSMEDYFDSVDNIDLKNIEVNLGESKLEVLYNGKPLEKYDCIYAKGSFKYEPLLRSITTALYKTTYMPLKPNSFTIGHDKLLTQLIIQQHKIPMPKTYLASTIESAKKILKKVNYPIVMKFPHGTQGKGVMFADSFSSASSVLDALSALKQPFIIQEYIETSGVDIRAIVVGDKVVASMKRKAELGEKRANIHVGGIGEPYILDAQAQKIAVNTAGSIGADICAVDMLEGSKGHLVIEVNVSPGLQGITEATKIDVADKIAKFLYQKAKSFKEAEKKVEAEEILREFEPTSIKEIITTLDFRGNRILLPELITKLTKFDDKDVSIKSTKGILVIRKFNMGKKK